MSRINATTLSAMMAVAAIGGAGVMRPQDRRRAEQAHPHALADEAEMERVRRARAEAEAKRARKAARRPREVTS